MSKKVKKIIVNSLTFSRVIGTILMPIFYTYLKSNIFLIVIGCLLLTDFFDGLLAKHWNVRTLFGSFLDMLADKMLAFAILIVVGTIYPLMFIPFALEVLIVIINIYSTHIGSVPKSRELGRLKMWILGVAIFILLLLSLDNILKIKFIYNNLLQIKYFFIGGSIFIELIVLFDYLIIMFKSSRKENKSLINFSDIKKNKDFIKNILFDEEYYIKTINLPLKDKVMPRKNS